MKVGDRQTDKTLAATCTVGPSVIGRLRAQWARSLQASDPHLQRTAAYREARSAVERTLKLLTVGVLLHPVLSGAWPLWFWQWPHLISC